MMLKYIFQKTPKHGCNVSLQGMIMKCTRNAWLSKRPKRRTVYQARLQSNVKVSDCLVNDEQ